MAALPTEVPTTALQLEPAPPNSSMLPPLLGELEAAVASCLEPAAFFVSWQVRTKNPAGWQLILALEAVGTAVNACSIAHF